MRTTVLTGATGGIGTAVAHRLAASGHHLCLFGRNRERGTLLAGELRSRGARCTFYECDVRNAQQVETGIRRARVEFGSIGGLVTAHGLLPTPTKFLATDMALFDAALEVNFRGTVTLMQSFLRTLGDDAGAIVNIASVAGSRAFPLSSAYAASKAALIHISKVVAQETGERVRVNVVNPGWIRTQMTARILEMFSMAEGDAVKPYPFRRAGLPEEVAEVVHWLLSDSSCYVSGAVINVDGGGLP